MTVWGCCGIVGVVVRTRGRGGVVYIPMLD